MIKEIKKWAYDKKFYGEAEKRRGVGEKMKRSMDLSGKKAVVFGIASDKSIGWSIAKTLNDNGCKLAIGYQERAGDYVKELAKELDNPILEVLGLLRHKIPTIFGLLDFFNKFFSINSAIIVNKLSPPDLSLGSILFASASYFVIKYDNQRISNSSERL